MTVVGDLLKTLGVSGGGFWGFGQLEHGIGGGRGLSVRFSFRFSVGCCFGFRRANTLNLHSGHALAIHFDDGKAQVAIVKTFATFGDEAELIEYEAADGGVRGVFGQGDVVLRVEVANVGSGVKNHRPIGQRERLFLNVKLVVNLSDHLLDDVLDGHETEDAAEFVHNHSHADASRAKLEEQLTGGLGLGDNENFTQDAPQIKRWRSEIFFKAAVAVEKNPHHVFDVYETQDMIERATINGKARTLCSGEGAHHLIERGFDGERVHIRTRHHDFPDLDL